MNAFKRLFFCGLIVCYLFSFGSCNDSVYCKYPKTVIDLGIEKSFVQAVNDWYYLNLNSPYHNPSYLVNFDTTIENYIYMRDTVRDVWVQDKTKTKDYEKMKSLFPQNVFSYSDAELFLFETENTKTINEDTIIFTLFPKLGKESYVIDLNSSYIYNFFYLKDELFRIGIGDYYELDISVDRNEVNLYVDSLLNTKSGQYEFLKCINNNARNTAPPSTRRNLRTKD